MQIKLEGDLSKTIKLLRQMSERSFDNILDRAARRGVDALAAATPVDSGQTAASWSYRIEKQGPGVTIVWTNSHINNGVPIAIILQYGHGTGTGGYVQGRDYINPAIKPVMDSIAKDVKEVVARG